ncbi:hypothetical protein GH714_030202 [Hevea brasiliensis]|uniref:VAN3-binding protein-like auxin canalisation domain-containing protein n=1 Tax=Hevea brasiliensis TaxID=3981 RepID=A0A6A6LXE6_HEVBR|nr:hypothetical protein GH714_030202 [Hevea brasiliensis]
MAAAAVVLAAVPLAAGFEEGKTLSDIMGKKLGKKRQDNKSRIEMRTSTDMVTHADTDVEIVDAGSASAGQCLALMLSHLTMARQVTATGPSLAYLVHLEPFQMIALLVSQHNPNEEASM